MRSYIHTLLLPGTLYEVLHTHFTAAILEELSRCILLAVLLIARWHFALCPALAALLFASRGNAYYAANPRKFQDHYGKLHDHRHHHHHHRIVVVIISTITFISSIVITFPTTVIRIPTPPLPFPSLPSPPLTCSYSCAQPEAEKP